MEKEMGPENFLFLRLSAYKKAAAVSVFAAVLLTVVIELLFGGYIRGLAGGALHPLYSQAAASAFWAALGSCAMLAITLKRSKGRSFRATATEEELHDALDGKSAHYTNREEKVLRFFDSNIHFQTDAEKLQCVIANLLANAIEYSRERSSVEIIALRERETLKISVADHGDGIEEKDHGAVFDRFRQLDAGATKRHAGHGLGLSVTRSILELLEGTVRLLSRKGEGAVFEVSLPESENEKADSFFIDGNEFFINGGKAPERF